MTITVLAGNVVRSTITFVPDTGTVDPAQVTCRYRSPARVVTTLTVVTIAANQFRADATVADTERDGPGVFRWESGAPKISHEDEFTVTRSGLADP